MKLALRLDDLQVETFMTTAVATERRGTVRGREFTHPICINTIQPCPPQTADDTCGMTCGPTCEPASCNPDTVCTCV